MIQFRTVFVAALLTAIFTNVHAKEKDHGPFHFGFEEIATNVWAGVRADSPRFPVMGNTMFVISDEGVVVFDGGGIPVMAEHIIEKIRSLTDAPVTHVVISHWHGDHNFGIYRFAEEFPEVEFVTHSFTDAAMSSTRMDYLDGYSTFVEERLPPLEALVASGVDQDGTPLTEEDLFYYNRMIKDAPQIDREYKRAKLTKPTMSFDQRLVINSGKRKIELLFLGAGNTAGDIVMWLPDEKIVATGDLVVLPAPYAFNVPPRAWAATLERLNALGYDKLVPGHGKIQSDTDYVDLVIEASTSIADQRDEMLAKGMSLEDIEAALDFSAFEERFTGGDAYIKDAYDSFFEGPFRAAAIKELSGEPMVEIIPKEAAE